MRVNAIAAGVVFLATASLAHAADPAGHYTVEGNNPNHGANYTGDVTVSKTGETYNIVWTIGGTKYYGTGIGDENFLAISYKSGSNTGLALYGEKDDGWLGIWTYAGGKALGAEKWTRD